MNIPPPQLSIFRGPWHRKIRIGLEFKQNGLLITRFSCTPYHTMHTHTTRFLFLKYYGVLMFLGLCTQDILDIMYKMCQLMLSNPVFVAKIQTYVLAKDCIEFVLNSSF